MITDQFSLEQLRAAKILKVERLGDLKFQFTFQVADQVLVGTCKVESTNGIALVQCGCDQWMHELGVVRGVSSVAFALALARANGEIG